MRASQGRRKGAEREQGGKGQGLGGDGESEARWAEEGRSAWRGLEGRKVGHVGQAPRGRQGGAGCGQGAMR